MEQWLDLFWKRQLSCCERKLIFPTKAVSEPAYGGVDFAFREEPEADENLHAVEELVR